MTSLKDKIKDLDFFLQLIIYHYSLPSIDKNLKNEIYKFNYLRKIYNNLNFKKYKYYFIKTEKAFLLNDIKQFYKLTKIYGFFNPKKINCNVLMLMIDMKGLKYSN